MLSIKNWDNKTWISSTKYIKSFNNFLLKQKKLNKESKILDTNLFAIQFTKSRDYSNFNIRYKKK